MKAMKSTGIIRRIDDLGRVVIPKEIRKTFGILEGDPLEIFIEREGILFRKYDPCCQICGTEDSIETIYEINICNECIGKIKKLNS